MANGMYNYARHDVVAQNLNLDTEANLQMMLLKEGTYTFDPDHRYVADVTPASNECDATNYSRQAADMTILGLDLANDRTPIAVADVTFVNLGGATNNQITSAVIFKQVTNDADSELVAHLDVTPPTDTNGANFTVRGDNVNGNVHFNHA